MISSPLTSARRRARASSVLNGALIYLALALTGLAIWIRYRFGDVSFEQIISNLPIAGGKGVGNNNLAVEVVLWCLAAPALVVAVAMLLTRRLRSPGVTRRRVHWVPAVLATVAMSVLLSVAGVPRFAIAQFYDSSIAAYYVTPNATAAPQRPKNLITIYLESTENTFGDSEVMGKNLLANLDQATTGWDDYRGLSQYEGGGWTMAGLVATQCGIPLKSQLTTEGLDYNKLGEEVAHYLPGATCLGDVLAEQGYTSVFVGGADDDFAGKKTYLTDHGYSQVLGLPDWKAAGEDERYISTEWGLADSHTLDHAATVLKTLHRSGRPFNLTVLTLDTHEPAGVFPDCDTDDEVKMATAIACSTKAVARFLEQAERAGYLDDTVVMVMGDHLKGTGENDSLRSRLSSVAHRTIVFRVHSPDPVQFTRRSADQLSVLPTTMDLLGLAPAEGRAGLGVSFVSDNDLAGTALSLPEDEYRVLLQAPSTKIYQQFWAPR